MKFRSFELKVEGAQETDTGLVLVNNNQPFSVRLQNHKSTRCDVILEYDGEFVGAFRLSPFHYIVTNYSETNPKKEFVFTKKDSSKKKNKTDNLLTATFMPEKEDTRLSASERSSFWISTGGGNYIRATKILNDNEENNELDYDLEQVSRIYLRLKEAPKKPKPEAINENNPVKVKFSTSIPDYDYFYP